MRKLINPFEYAEKLISETGSWVVAVVETSIFWPPKLQAVEYEGKDFVLMPFQQHAGSTTPISFDRHEEARKYLEFIAKRGLKIMLINEDNPQNTDALLVDQVFGPSFRVYWLDFIHLDANPDATQNDKTKRKKTQDRIFETITNAATDEEVVTKEEVRVIGWSKGEIAFPREWEYRKSKSMELEFMRMAENRSSLTH